jgi:hypothetical protein
VGGATGKLLDIPDGTATVQGNTLL